MFERLRNSFCHPRLLGLYYKDKIIKPIILVICSFIMFMIFSVIIALNTEHLKYDDTKIVSDLISRSNSADVEFDSRTSSFSGNPVKFESNTFVVDFLSVENYAESEKMVMRFNAKNMDFIYNGYVLGTYTYSNYNIESFSIKLLQKGEMRNTIEFQNLLYDLFLDINKDYSKIIIANDAVVCFGYYIIILIVALVISYFNNPEIQGRIRVKLCMYSTLVYFLVMIIAIIYSAQWLQYVALGLPLIFTNITFSRIIRVKKQIQ